jgi:anti-sigma factor RsiW
MIRKLQSGEYRLYSRKVDPKTGKRRNLGTFNRGRPLKARARRAIFQAALAGSVAAGFPHDAATENQPYAPNVR